MLIVSHLGVVAMNISAVAQQTGLSAKTIRYYESIGLILPAKRADNGYRDYESGDVGELQFLQRARATGFGIEECRQLLELSRDSSRRSSCVKQLVLEKAERVAEQIAELNAIHTSLMDMAGQCVGDDGPECAIIDELKSKGEVS